MYLGDYGTRFLVSSVFHRVDFSFNPSPGQVALTANMHKSHSKVDTATQDRAGVLLADVPDK